MSEEILLRFSGTPDFWLQRMHQPQEPGPKPVGLWLSVGMAWREWCQGEDWRVSDTDYAVRIYLTKDARILRITNSLELDTFQQEYEAHVSRLGIAYRTFIPGFVIDWPAVARKFHGIIISPYLYSRRFDPGSLWYYGWDCASGCIWDIDAIEKFLPYNVQQPEPGNTLEDGPPRRVIELG